MNTRPLLETVTISLPKEFIPHLLGALRLGIWLENWCADLCMSEINTFDSWSRHWSNNVLHMMDLIKEQTSIQDEFKAYGIIDGWLDEVATWVNRQCDKNLKRCMEHEKGICKDHGEQSLP